jgi:hypothetical protein
VKDESVSTKRHSRDERDERVPPARASTACVAQSYVYFVGDMQGETQLIGIFESGDSPLRRIRQAF